MCKKVGEYYSVNLKLFADINNLNTQKIFLTKLSNIKIMLNLLSNFKTIRLCPELWIYYKDLLVK